VFVLLSSAQAPEAGAVAYDKKSGEVVWRTPYLGNESYASPSVVKIDSEDHLVFVISSTNPIGRRDLPQTLGKVVGVEPLSGKILWEYDQWECHISVPSAVDAGENGDRMASRFGIQNWAPMALADGKLLIRDQSRLLCLKVVE
jgi:hypothetical protein